MKLWIDDVRPAPDGYIHTYSIEEAICKIMRYEHQIDYAWQQYVIGRMNINVLKRYIKKFTITEISCDNDLGEGNAEGYKLLDWLEATGRNYPINIHSANPVARERMRAIIHRNGWKEVI